MENLKRTFEPGAMVTAISGPLGIVLSPEELDRIQQGRLRQGRRPGHYFAPGCCSNPDYRIQVPVLFEDGTWDIMRAINLKRASAAGESRREHILDVLKNTEKG